jgi:hypothetical protein
MHEVGYSPTLEEVPHRLQRRHEEQSERQAEIYACEMGKGKISPWLHFS